MEEIHSLVEKIKSDIQEGKTGEEIASTLAPVLKNDPERAGQVIEALAKIAHLQIARTLQYLLLQPGDKKVGKIIKRSLYRLKNKGIAVEAMVKEKESPVFRPLQAEPSLGFMGPIDFLGRRFVMLVIPHPGHGLTVMQGIIGDAEGMVDFSGAEMTRKRFRVFFEEVQQDIPFPLVETEPAYVAFLFTQAHRLTLDRGKTPPRDYLHLRSRVEGIKKEYERPLIYSLLRVEELEGNDSILARGGDLLKTDVFTAWKIGEEEIRPYADEIGEAEESRLVLSQAQKEARFQEIYQRAFSGLFPEEKRSLYRRRMEEMAYVLFMWRREEEAKIAMAVALDLKKPVRLLQPNPFLLQLVVRSILMLLSEAYEKKKREVSLIARP